MVRVFLLLFLAEVVLTSLALISCLSADRPDVRGLPRYGWVLVILFLPILGAVAWFLAGRPVSRPAGGSAGSRPFRSGPARPVAPDDDPEFLRSLRHRDKTERELFDRWETDLTTPPERDRRGGGPEPDPGGRRRDRKRPPADDRDGRRSPGGALDRGEAGTSGQPGATPAPEDSGDPPRDG